MAYDDPHRQPSEGVGDATRDGDLARAAWLYAEAARKAPNLAERDYPTRQAARLNTGPCP